MTRNALNAVLIGILWLSPQSAQAVDKVAVGKSELPPRPGLSTRSKIPAWEVDQLVSNWGTQNFLIAPDAVKMEDKSRGYVTVCKAPDWNVVSYAPTRKKIASTPLSKFDGGFTRRFTVMMATFSGCENPAKVPGWLKDGFWNYRGQICQKWVLQPEIAAKRQLNMWKMLNSTEIKAAPQVVAFLAREHSLPNHGSVCLYYQNGHSTARPVIQTTNMRKRLASMREFDPPKGFEKSTPEEVMFANQDFDM